MGKLLIVLLVPDVDVLVLLEAFDGWFLRKMRPITAPTNLAKVLSAIASVHSFEAGVSDPIGAVRTTDGARKRYL